MTNDAIKLKIRKLLELGNDQRGNENEANNALELAARLMLEHGLNEEQCRAPTDKKPEVTRGDKFEYKTEWQWHVASAVHFLYGTRPKILRDYNSAQTEVEDSIVFFGRAELVDASQETFKFILEQIEEQYKRALPKGLTQRNRAMWRRDFKEAAADRVWGRALEIKINLERNTPTTNTGSTALTVVSYRQQLDDEIEELFDRLWPARVKARTAPPSTEVKKKRKQREPKPRKEKKRAWDAIDAGERAGAHIKLNKQVRG